MTQPDIMNKWVMQGLYFEKKPPEEYLELIESPNVIAISNYVWNEQYNLILANHIKNKWPKCNIIFGGPQVPSRKERLELFFTNHKFIDYTVHGEGELSMANLLRTITQDDDELSSGISVNGEIINTTCSRIQDLSVIPDPYGTGIFDDIIASYPNTNFNTTMETNRGCPYKCTFCDWGSVTFDKLKTFPMDNVKSAIKWSSNNKIQYLMIADANFGIFAKRDLEITNHIIDTRTITGYPDVINVNWQKNNPTNTIKIIKLLNDNGLSRGMTLSVQSMDPIVLENINRKNMEINDLSAILKETSKYNISTYTELILGLPGETYQSWINGYNNLLTAGQHDWIDFYPAGLLENAVMNSDASIEKYEISSIPITLTLFNTTTTSEITNIIHSTNTMPFSDIKKAIIFSWTITTFHIFGWTEIISRWLHTVNTITYIEFYQQLNEFIISYTDTNIKQIITDRDNMTNHESITGTFVVDGTVSLHKNFTTTITLIKEFINKHYPQVPNQVLDFNREYIATALAPTEKTIRCDFPIWDIITHNMAWNPDRYEQTDYILTTPFDFDSEEAFYDALYFRRRVRIGRYTVTRKDK